MDQAEIKSFLNKYSKGDYSEEEHSRFIDWLRTASIPQIEKIAEEYSRIVEHKPLSSSPSSPRIIEQIEAALNRREDAALPYKPINNRVFLIRRVGAAAAIALLIAGLLSYWLLNKKSTENVNGNVVASGVQDIQAPQSAKAVITLGNGQVIYLDSAESGVLTKQGSVNVIKTAGGSVAYKSLLEQAKTGRPVYNTLYNPRGSKIMSLTLADGTKVWLNAASSLRYPVSFNGKERKVEITGEAYFEVARDVGKKFIVDAGGVITEVLGTHFNVNAYRDEGRTVITLLEGAVRVKDSGASVVIRPGQQAVAANGVRIVKNADVVSAMAWKNGEFIMKSADVGSIMRQVARWYNVDVVYEAGIPEARITGEVSRNLDLSEILQVLKYSGIHVKVNDRKVIVKP